MKDTLYHVTWKDHSSSSGWMSKSDGNDFNVTVVESVGWFVAQDDTTLILCSSRTTTKGSTTQRMYILKNCIIKKKRISL